MKLKQFSHGFQIANPIFLISTWFGVGLLPLAPGTWGSLAALPVAWLITTYLGQTFLLVFTILLFFLGLWTSEIYANHTNDTDPKSIVVDEVVGQIIVTTAIPLSVFWYLTAFILFRISDILKPWPVSWLDKKINGGLGIMLDDVAAAGYAWIILFVLNSYLVIS